VTLRRSLLALVLGGLVMATALSGQSTARSAYPFVDAGPLRAPEVLYMPTYFPDGGQGLFLSMRFGPNGAGTDFELHYALASGELVVWESTRGDATVGEFERRYSEDGEVPGAVTWHAGHVAGAGTALIHARIGQTLVVITGPLPIDELLRIANALRRESPSSLML
jgi:hypothetical protein